MWLLQYRSLLGFMDMGFGCYSSCLQVLGSRVLLRLSQVGHPVQGFLQLLVFIHLHLKGTTCTTIRGIREKILGDCVM